MRQSYLSLPLALLCGIFSSPWASGQTCAGNTGVINGSYVFVAIETGPITGTVATSGSGSTTVAYSNTELGRLLSGVTGASAFSSTGSLSFNSFGQVFASPSAQGGTSTLVGTYVVNSDCTTTVSLNDPFGTNTTAVTKLSGIILNGGNEVDLFALPPTTPLPSGTSAPPPSAGIQSQGGLLVRLVRPFFGNFGCTAGNLSGTYALVLNGTTGTQPLVLTIRAFFDGAGNVIADPAAVGSPLSALQSVGTYTINSDCAGTMTLKSSTVTSTGTNPTTTLNFVLTAPNIVVNVGATNISQYSTHPGLVLSLSSTTQTAFGTGTAQ
jgi:hypothetical protein